jgi:hypothetical protein
MNPEPPLPILEIVGAITPLILLILRWVDKHHEKKWKRDDVQHKQRMELCTMNAARAAVTAVDAVESSKVERSRQMGEIKELIATNTEVSEAAFREANGVNAKIASLGVEIAKNSSKP